MRTTEFSYSPTTTTDYSQLANDGNTSLLTYVSDQGSIGVALDDDGADEDESLPDNVINPAAVVTVGAGIAKSAVNAVSGMNPVAMVNAGVGMADSVVNAISGDALATFQAGVGISMSGVRIAASIGTWNEARQRRKAAAQFAAIHGPADPAVNSKVANSDPA